LLWNLGPSSHSRPKFKAISLAALKPVSEFDHPVLVFDMAASCYRRADDCVPPVSSPKWSCAFVAEGGRGSWYHRRVQRSFL